MNSSSTNLPEIRINFSYLLYQNESKLLDLYRHKGERKLKDSAYYKQLAGSYRAEWNRYEHELVRAMQEVLGVTFYRQVIDVSLAPFFISQSTPLIINFRDNPDEFVDTLTHELIHVLLTDNNVHQSNAISPKLDLMNAWENAFGHHEPLVLAHIPVHAVHKALYLSTLKAPDRLSGDIERTASKEAYAKAWQYVNEYDYMDIIDKLRSMYTSTY